LAVAAPVLAATLPLAAAAVPERICYWTLSTRKVAQQLLLAAVAQKVLIMLLDNQAT